MISGPIIPKTRDSLRDLLSGGGLDGVESGLALVLDDLVLDNGVRIDAVLQDASRRPVLAFLAELGMDHDLPARVPVGRDWFLRNRYALGRVIDADIDLAAPPRCLVLGFDFSAVCTDGLRATGIEDLEVLRLEPFRIGGRCEIGVTSVLGDGLGPHAFGVPDGILGAEPRRVAGSFLGWLERLDPDLRVDGDRFSRRVFVGRRALCELWFHRNAVMVRTPELDDRELLGTALDDDVRDCVVRGYLAALDAADTPSQPELAVAAAAPVRPSMLTPVGSPPMDLGTGSAARTVAEPSRSLERLSSQMTTVEVSPEEYSAFRNLESRPNA